MNFQRLRNDLIAIVLLGVAVFLGLSLVCYDPADPPAEQIYPARASVGNLAGEPGALELPDVELGLALRQARLAQRDIADRPQMLVRKGGVRIDREDLERRPPEALRAPERTGARGRTR